MKFVPGSNRRPDLPLAVIVGAGGLGMAVAKQLGLSHRLLLADRDRVHLEAAIVALQSAGYDAQGQVCDVTCRSEVSALAETAKCASPVRALAYVVGLSPSLGTFEDILDVNLRGAARALTAFREVLTPGGAALCVSSSAAHMQQLPNDLSLMLDEPLDDHFVEGLERALGVGAVPAMAYVLSKQGLIRFCRRIAASWGIQWSGTCLAGNRARLAAKAL